MIMAMIHDPEHLSTLIGDIYDAAIDPTRWVDALRKAREFVGEYHASLSWKDAVAKRGGSYFEEGDMVPSNRQLYFDKYVN